MNRKTISKMTVGVGLMLTSLFLAMVIRGPIWLAAISSVLFGYYGVDLIDSIKFYIKYGDHE